MNTQALGYLAVLSICVLIFLFIMSRLSKTKKKNEEAYALTHPKSFKVPKEQPPETILTNCPFCHGKLEPNVLKCMHCGEWLDKEHRNKEEQLKKAQLETAKHSKSTNQAIGWIVFILFGLPALIYLFKGC